MFGYVNSVDALAGGDITKWNDIYNLPYNWVFAKLYKNKVEAEYQKRYNQLSELHKGINNK